MMMDFEGLLSYSIDMGTFMEDPFRLTFTWKQLRREMQGTLKCMPLYLTYMCTNIFTWWLALISDNCLS